MVFVIAISAQGFAKTVNSTDANTYFFTQSGETMTLAPGKLVIHHITPKTLWFADAPSRDTGTLTTSNYEFMEYTNYILRTVHPNAVLTGYIPAANSHGTPKRLTAVLILKNAHYNPVTNNLTYHAVKNYLMPDKHNVNQTVTLSHPTLLIDVLPNICLPGQSCTKPSP